MTGTLLQGRYRLDDQLGTGGMGAVYRGYDTVLKRQVAIKVLSNLREGSRGPARLLVEAQAAAQLNHPNIVTVYDVGQTDQLTPFIVMELVEGQTLRREAPYAFGEVVRIGRQLCQALEHAHAHGIIHRDLKPENILLTTGEVVKLTDFGLARIAGAPRLTQEGAIIGTTSYLAPELLGGEPASVQSDLYALGVILYELSAGQPPFTGDSLVAILGQHLHSPVTPPSTHNPAIPAELDTLIVKLLAKTPDARPPSASQVDGALASIAMGVGPAAHPAQYTEFSLLDRIVRGRLVGRQAELGQLHQLWQLAWQGQAQLALISGEPGVGKTRLADELLVDAQLRGAAVLRGACYEFEAVAPYLPFVEALRDWVHRQAAEQLRAALGVDQSPGMAAELARLAPEIETKLGPQPPNPALELEEARSRLFDYLARFFSSLAASTGLVIFIDDLHWADSSTLTLLPYLLRRLRHDKLLVLATYRDVELDRSHPLAAALGGWQREHWATRTALYRLSGAETSAMLAGIFSQERVSDEFAAAIFRETEGNPFFVEEVVKALIEQGQIFREDGHWTSCPIEDLTIPQSVREAIGRRLDRLSADCAAMLQIAAFLGKQFAFGELAAVWHDNGRASDEEALLDRIDEAVGAQLLRPLQGDRFAFTHDKIREVLVDEPNPIRRRRLHLRVGRALEALYADDPADQVQALAYHFVAAGELERGLVYSQRAGERAAALFSLDEAVQYLEQAQASAQELANVDALREIEEELGRVHQLRGAYADASAAYARAFSLTATPQQRAAIKIKMMGVEVDAGLSSDMDALAAAIAELDPVTQPVELAAALTSLGRSHHYRNELDEAIANFEKARELAEPLGDIEALTAIYGYLAGAYQHKLDLASSIAWANKLIALGRDHDYPFAEAIGYEFLAEDATLAGNWADALEFAQRDLEIAERIEAQDRICWGRYNLLWAWQQSGELRRAIDAAPPLFELAAALSSHRVEFFTRQTYCLALTDLGDLEAAETQLELLAAAAAELGQRYAEEAVFHIRLTILCQRERWDDAVSLAQPFLASLERVHRIIYCYAAPTVASALIHTSALDEAETLIADFLAFVDAIAMHVYATKAQSVVAQLRLAQGRLDAALDAATRAVTAHAQLGPRHELVRSLYQRGLVHQARQDRAAAASDFARASALAAELGMVLDQTRADRARAALPAGAG